MDIAEWQVGGLRCRGKMSVKVITCNNSKGRPGTPGEKGWNELDIHVCWLFLPFIVRHNEEYMQARH